MMKHTHTNRGLSINYVVGNITSVLGITVSVWKRKTDMEYHQPTVGWVLTFVVMVYICTVSFVRMFLCPFSKIIVPYMWSLLYTIRNSI